MTRSFIINSNRVFIISVFAVLVLGADAARIAGAVFPDECSLNKWELNNGAKIHLPDGTPKVIIQKVADVYASPNRCYYDNGSWYLCSELCSSEQLKDKAACSDYYCSVYADCYAEPQVPGFEELCAGVFPNDFNYTKRPPVVPKPTRVTQYEEAKIDEQNTSSGESNWALIIGGLFGTGLLAVVVIGSVITVRRRRERGRSATTRGATSSSPAMSTRSHPHPDDDSDFGLQELTGSPNPSKEVQHGDGMNLPLTVPRLDDEDDRPSTSIQYDGIEPHNLP